MISQLNLFESLTQNQMKHQYLIYRIQIINVQYIKMHQRENSQQFFEKYISGGDDLQNIHQNSQPQDSPHYHLQKEEIELHINRINMKLDGMTNQKIGNVFSTDLKQIQQTLRIIDTLINYADREHQNRLKLSGEMRQLQNLNFTNTNTIDKLNKDKITLQNDRNNFLQTVKHNQKKFKDLLEKINHEKEDLTKQLRQIQIRQKTIDAEFRKKQSQIKQYQQQIKKFQQEKPIYKNNFDVLHKFENGNGLLHFSTNAENQYGQLASESIQNMYKKLITENQYLKECLTNIYKELNSVLELKKQMLKNRRGYDEYQEYFEVNSIRPDTFNLPQEFSRQRLKQLNENIHKFKQAMKIGDLAQTGLDDRKQSCVGGVKQMIKNYKQIVDSQDQLLNKVILKSKEFKAAEMSHLQNQYARINQTNQIDRAKKFVELQAQYLESKNQELEKTRRMMQTAMKKAEENKRQMLRQRQTFESQALQIRRSIEVLPLMVEQELSKNMH